MPKSISKINKNCYLVYKKNINKIFYKQKKNFFFKKFLLIKHKATKKKQLLFNNYKNYNKSKLF